MTIKEYFVNEIQIIKKEISEFTRDFINDTLSNLLDDNNYILGDLITEYSDYNIDIYYCDLFDWAKDNTYWCDEALLQGVDFKEIVKIIQFAQFLAFEDELYENKSDILKVFVLCIVFDKLEKMVDIESLEIKKEQIDLINDNLEYINENYCDIDNLKDDLKPLIDDILKGFNLK